MIRRLTWGVLCWAACALSAPGLAAVQEPADATGAAGVAPPRPWLALPLVSSDPKVGTSAGALLGYVRRFDAASPNSVMGVAATYSDTDSHVAAAFARLYFAGDRHRIVLGAGTGEINNDYDDFLGSGLPLQTTDDLRFAGGRYLYGLRKDLYVGVMGLSTNYAISGDNILTDRVLALLGLTGFDSNGLGAVVQYDSRDHVDSPTSGRFLEVSNLAYRTGLGGDVSFDSYRLKLRQFVSHGAGHVLGMRLDGRWTQGAPVSGYSSVDLRGYVKGNYLAPHAVTVEVEERLRLADRWGLALFAGASLLRGDDGKSGLGTAWYPGAGVGLIYTIKPAERMVVRLDAAVGRDDSRGLYVRFGHPF